MTIVTTEWALQAYTDLYGRGVFTDAEYWSRLRPDVERLKVFPNDPEFANSNFWGPARDLSKKNVPDGYKMKWHNIGPGKNQLRLAVALINGNAYLCQAYVKNNAWVDPTNAAILKNHINDIYAGNAQIRGVLP